MMLFIFVQPRKVYAQSEMCSTGSNYPNALTVVGSHADERNLEKADSLLQTLPLQTPEDADFYNFFNAYLAQLQTNPYLLPFDGKAPTAAALQIQNMAAPATPPNSAALFAQSVQATQQNIAYTRMPADTESEKLMNTPAPPLIRFVPNPAQDLVYLFIDTQELQGQVHVYNAMGMPVMTKQVNNSFTGLNVTQLANGVYFCRFTTNSGKHTTGKFVILR